MLSSCTTTRFRDEGLDAAHQGARCPDLARSVRIHHTQCTEHARASCMHMQGAQLARHAPSPYPCCPRCVHMCMLTATVPVYVQVYGCFGLQSIRRACAEVAQHRSPLRERVVHARLPCALVGRATAVRVARPTKARSTESECCRRTSRN